MEANRHLLLPAVALAAWTFVMWAWMYATRIPAIRRAGMKLDGAIPRGEQMATLPAEVRWKADNYNHLFEQPTIFYPIVLVAALLPGRGSADLGLAWAYVALRVIHSVFQATVNKIEVRFVLFLLPSLVLLALVARTGMALL
ncbi:MAG: MAPEG family protein [Deltaproteobacteria bacterium]|nr:MAPEG family protein [Deltaproteobacteria bacterium]